EDEEERFAMSRRTPPPFRADHVGSLLRPPRLHQAREDFAAGRISPADLRAVEDEEITRAVRMQEEVGLQSATDGEFRRATWHMDFIYQIGGVSKAPGNLAVKFTNPSGTIEWTPAALHFVAEALFSGLDVDGFFLEYDDERSGGFEPLRFVPEGKQVVLGLVTTKRPELESKDDLKRRVEEAAKFVPLEQIALSGQCGFSSTVE